VRSALHAETELQPQRPDVHTFEFGTSAQSRSSEHSQRPLVALQCETPGPPQSVSLVQRQRRVVASQTDPFLWGVQSALLVHPATHAPSAQVRLALAQTSALPEAPRRGSVTSSGFGLSQPFEEGARRAQRPTPPTSTQTSSEKKKQSASELHAKTQKLEPGRHSIDERQGSENRSQR
jgi:hypothetical protein